MEANLTALAQAGVENWENLSPDLSAVQFSSKYKAGPSSRLNFRQYIFLYSYS